MNRISDNDLEFLQGVDNKIRYLEYIKAEEEQVEFNKRDLRKKAIKNTAIFMLLIVISSLILVSYGFEFSTLLLISIFIFGIGEAYEYFNSTDNTLLIKTKFKCNSEDKSN